MSDFNEELNKINNKRIKNIVKNVLLKFFEKDVYFLENNMNEVSITQKLGCYFQELFSEYNVDTEYNRDHNNPKQIVQDGRRRNIKPDIIVHNRGSNDFNYLVIEAKKSNNRDAESDLDKLQAYLRTPLEYDFALFIEFQIGRNVNENNFIKRIEFYEA